MNKTNYLKIFSLAAFAFLLTTTVNAQSGVQRVQNSKQIDANSLNKEKITWLYSTVNVTIENGRVKVESPKLTMKPKTKEEQVAMKMQYRQQDQLKSAADTFHTEADVLNYLSRQGMELVTVVPSEKEKNVKTYYLRSKMPQ